MPKIKAVYVTDLEFYVGSSGTGSRLHMKPSSGSSETTWDVKIPIKIWATPQTYTPGQKIPGMSLNLLLMQKMTDSGTLVNTDTYTAFDVPSGTNVNLLPSVGKNIAISYTVGVITATDLDVLQSPTESATRSWLFVNADIPSGSTPNVSSVPTGSFNAGKYTLNATVKFPARYSTQAPTEFVSGLDSALEPAASTGMWKIEVYSPSGIKENTYTASAVAGTPIAHTSDATWGGSGYTEVVLTSSSQHEFAIAGAWTFKVLWTSNEENATAVQIGNAFTATCVVSGGVPSVTSTYVSTDSTISFYVTVQ